MALRVDVHAHYLPPPDVEALRSRNEPPRLVEQHRNLALDFGAGGMFPLHPEMIDLDLQLEAMASAGIDEAVLSIIPPAVDGLKLEDAAVVARASNDALSEIARNQSGTFAALATLPRPSSQRRSCGAPSTLV
jgi:hypothetical protein